MDRKRLQDKSSAEQNKFTAYLRVSLIRTRVKYLHEKKQRQLFAISCDSDFGEQNHDSGDLLRFLPLKDQLNSVQISNILADLTNQEYSVLYLHIFEERTF